VQLQHYLGLSGRGKPRPSELSGGEQQRVAIARAVAIGSAILLAGEPTGNLDSKTATHVFEALDAIVRATGLAALIATHNIELARRMDRRVTSHEGVWWSWCKPRHRLVGLAHDPGELDRITLGSTRF